MKRRLSVLLTVLVAFALIAAACGSDGGDTDTASGGGGDGALPGEGIQVTMARANWASGYIQAEIYRQVLGELGYEVSDPADLELAPDLFYNQLSEGEIDFWTNSWYPGHLTWWEGDRADGSRIGDFIQQVDGLFQDAGVQGMLVTRSWAEENDITSMQQINDDPALFEQLDTDGNGVGNFYGCPEDWTCDDIMTNQIAFYGWDNLEQTQAGYDAMFAEALDIANAGDPMIIYTWTPSSYVTELIPGDNVLWLTMHPTDVLDESNPSGAEGGENHQQGEGFTSFGADTCTQPCQLGWEAADIQVTANTEWAEANPAAIAMFEVMRPSVIDISIAQVEQANGDGSQDDVVRIAEEWVANNRDIVDGWLDVAIAAG